MTHIPERWRVGYDKEYDIDIFTVTGEDQIEIIAEHIRDERTAFRIATLWNMAERLSLTTEKIENGKIDKALLKLEELELMIERGDLLNKAAPDMLRALEEVMGELDVEGLPCPLCGRNLTIGHRHNCIWHVVESAVRKARGEE